MHITTSKFILVFTKRSLSAGLKPQDSFAKSFSKMHLEFWMDKREFCNFEVNVFLRPLEIGA